MGENKLVYSLGTAVRTKVFSLGRFQQCLGNMTPKKSISETIEIAVDVRYLHNPVKRNWTLRYDEWRTCHLCAQVGDGQPGCMLLLSLLLLVVLSMKVVPSILCTRLPIELQSGPMF